jgi:hypothetical protein
MRSWSRPSRRPTPAPGCASKQRCVTGDYPIGIAISKERFAALPLHRHATHGTWNYTLHPQLATTTEVAPVGESGGLAGRRQAMLHRLNDPRLTGITSTDLK